MNENEFINLIKKYIACSKYMCDSLKDYYLIKETTLLLARKSYNLLPKEGYLPDNIYFNFHGVGIFFEFEGGEIDVDFGPEGRCDGFDFNRLKHFFMATTGKADISSQDEAILGYHFQNLIKRQLIYNPKWHPSTHLFYFQ